MSPSSARDMEAGAPSFALQLVGRRRQGSSLARGVRERPRFATEFASLLAGARELPSLTADNLPIVAQTLAQLGELVMLGYDERARRFVCFARAPRPAAPTAASPGHPEADLLERKPAHSTERTGRRGAVDAAIGALEYEAGGNERCVLGSVTTDAGSWWSVVLAVPGDTPAGNTLFVRLARHGPTPADYRGAIEAELSLPASEVDSVVVLLTGVIDQARRDGVLPTLRHDRAIDRG